MLRTIKLYGELGKKFGRTHQADINSVGEALRFLDANYKGFKKHIADSIDKVAGYEIWDGNYNLDETVEDFIRQGDKPIKIIPRIAGAGAGARIVAGAVLMVVGYALSGWTGGASLGLSEKGVALMASTVMAAGASLVLGGIIQLIAPKSNLSTSATESEGSYIFNGAMNSTKLGNAVIIGYGEHICGSQVLSATITTEDVGV